MRLDPFAGACTAYFQQGARWDSIGISFAMGYVMEA